MDWHWLLGAIVTTSRGDDGTPYRTVPLSIVVTIGVFLVSAIGAQQTIIWTASHERAAVATEMKSQMIEILASHQAVDSVRSAEVERRLGALEQLGRDLDQRSRENARQISINTGKLEQGAAWRGR